MDLLRLLQLHTVNAALLLALGLWNFRLSMNMSFPSAILWILRWLLMTLTTNLMVSVLVAIIVVVVRHIPQDSGLWHHFHTMTTSFPVARPIITSISQPLVFLWTAKTCGFPFRDGLPDQIASIFFFWMSMISILETVRKVALQRAASVSPDRDDSYPSIRSIVVPYATLLGVTLFSLFYFAVRTENHTLFQHLLTLFTTIPRHLRRGLSPRYLLRTFREQADPHNTGFPFLLLLGNAVAGTDMIMLSMDVALIAARMLSYAVEAKAYMVLVERLRAERRHPTQVSTEADILVAQRVLWWVTSVLGVVAPVLKTLYLLRILWMRRGRLPLPVAILAFIVRPAEYAYYTYRNLAYIWRTVQNTSAPAPARTTTTAPASTAPAVEEEEDVPVDEQCAICLQRLNDRIATPCHHQFCRACIQSWMRVTPACPMCRRGLDHAALFGQGETVAPPPPPQVEDLHDPSGSLDVIKMDVQRILARFINPFHLPE